MQFNFNAYDYDPSQGGAICFPLADYKVEITAAEPKVVKDNPSAGYLELTLTVLEGELRGLTHKDRLNIFHTSEVAKRIAHQTLSAYCFAINRPYVQDTNDLIGGRLIATIGPQADDSKYSDVKQIKCMDGSLPTRGVAAQAGVPARPPGPPAPPAPTQAAPAPVPPPPPTAPPAPPWNTAPTPAPAWAGQQPSAPPAPNAAGLPPWAKQAKAE